MYRIAVTNRCLCQGDFLARVKQLAEDTKYQAILLRERDLEEEAYEELAGQVLDVTNKYNKKCILHGYPEVAMRLHHPYLHLPLPVWEQMTAPEQKLLRRHMAQMGTSVHSLEQLKKAHSFNADYVIAGHVFPTDCKRDVPPRGLDFIREICAASTVPVYGIGGITEEREELVVKQGAVGICCMSGAMRHV